MRFGSVVAKPWTSAGVWTDNFIDGTGEITGVMAAENIRIAEKAVKALADTVCAHDGRKRNQRNSDAMFALLTGTIFECQCGRDDCDAEIPPDPPAEVVRSVSTEIVIHVVTDAAVIEGAPGIGWVDGHGVVSDEHVRDLANRPDAIIKPVTPVRTPAGPCCRRRRERRLVDRGRLRISGCAGGRSVSPDHRVCGVRAGA